MGISNDLLVRGYFPKELPPVFTTVPFGQSVSSGAVTAPSSHKWTSLVKHSLSRAGGLRRPLSVPHPFHFIRLARAIEHAWTTDLQPVLFQNSAARESASLQGLGWSVSLHSRSRWRVLNSVRFPDPAERRARSAAPRGIGCDG